METTKVSGFWLAPTYSCNNRCLWCYAGGKLHLVKEASIDDIKNSIEKLARAGAKTCVLVGGEPTMYPHLMETIAFATRLGIKVKMMSNGRRLSDRDFVKQLKSVGLKYCSISIEGTEEIHDRITQNSGSYRQSVAGIKNCQIEGMPVNSITTVGSHNLANIRLLVEELQTLKLRRAAFNMCSAQPSGYIQGENDGIIDLHDYARIVEDVCLKFDFVCFYALIPLCLYDQEKLSELVRLNRIHIACSLFSNNITIDAQGNILPCTHMAGLSYGNILEEGGLGRAMEKKSKDMAYLKSHAPSEKCVQCKLWNTCLGGCNLIWFARKAEGWITGIEEHSERR